MSERRTGLRTKPPPASSEPLAAITLPLRLRYRNRELNFFSTFTTFVAPRDITLAELALEAFYPADPTTIEAVTTALS